MRDKAPNFLIISSPIYLSNGTFLGVAAFEIIPFRENFMKSI
jgi:hypothetical protein